MSRPLFSIVMPVRNGEATFGWALESALSQDFDDFEIVILDNNSTDATAEIIAANQRPRIRSLRNEQALSMPDNFEKAWGFARGHYVLYLCDDDALLPNSLSWLAKNSLDGDPLVVSWRYGVYYHPDWHVASQRGLLRIYRDHGGIVDVPAERLREMVYSFSEPDWAPRMQNCMVQRKPFEDFRIQFSRLFRPLCPDYAFLGLTSHLVKEIRTIRRPLYIAGRSEGSIGAVQATNQGKAADDFLREFGDEDRSASGPCGIPVIANLIAATLDALEPALRSQGIDPAKPDLKKCFLRAAFNVRYIEAHVGPRPDLRERLADAAERKGADLPALVSSAFAEDRVVSPGLVSRVFDRIIKSSSILNRLEVHLRHGGDLGRARRRIEVEPGVTVRGEQLWIDGSVLEMKTILDATRVAQRLFDQHSRPRSNRALG